MYKKGSYIIYRICLLHVSVTLLAILSDVHYKGYTITKLYEPWHKCKVLNIILLAYIFLNISFVMHVPKDGHKSGRNM